MLEKHLDIVLSSLIQKDGVRYYQLTDKGHAFRRLTDISVTIMIGIASCLASLDFEHKNLVEMRQKFGLDINEIQSDKTLNSELYKFIVNVIYINSDFFKN